MKLSRTLAQLHKQMHKDLDTVIEEVADAISEDDEYRNCLNCTKRFKVTHHNQLYCPESTCPRQAHYISFNVHATRRNSLKKRKTA